MLKIKQTLLALALIISLSGIIVAPATYAAPENSCVGKVLEEGQSCCGGVVTSIISCPDNFSSDPVKNTGIWGILLLVINIMTAGIAVVAVGGVAYAAVLYASAGGRVDQVKKAVQVIMNIIAGAAMYAIAWSLLNWLIPGGVF